MRATWPTLIFASASRQSQLHATAGLFLWITVLGVPDYLTGLHAPLSLFYALATTLAGYFCSPRTAVALCAWAYTVHSFTSPPSGWGYFDDAFRLLLWLGTAHLGHLLRRRFDDLHLRSEQLIAAQDRLQTHLERARHVQRRLMRTAVVTDPRLELAWESEVALSLGGDYLDLRQNGDTFCLLLADVSGKGPSAALVAAALHALVDEEFSATAGPGAQLKRINERCCELLPEEMFVTCFCAHWNLSDGRISYANAGHESPLLIRSGGNTLLPLSSTGLPLGIDASDSPAEATLQAEPGDVLVAYTDGLIDSLDEHGRRLQPEDVESALRICHDRPAGSILHELKRLSPALRQGQLCDDLLLLVARWKGCPGPHPEN